jgi:hypothetical protein
MSTQYSDSVGIVDQIAMALGGLAVVIGMVVWPPLIAFGLLVWTLYVLYELVTPGSIEPIEPTAGSPMG